MSSLPAPPLLPSVCPHDCPSACALSVELGPDGRVGRLRGGAMPYTDGVICAKVARYAERVHHPDRILAPLLRTGPKGSGQFRPIGWDEAMDRLVEGLGSAQARLGPETVWPYFYAGTMGVVQQAGMHRLRRAMGWSGQAETICSALSGAGWRAGVGRKTGPDPREIPDADLVVIWGANPAATQVHLMGLIAEGRKRRGTRLVVIDPYRTATAAKADLHLMPRPGTDGALACAVMHVLLRDNLADRAYLARYTDGLERLEPHLAERGPDWAAPITGLAAADIEAFARLYGSTRRSYLRVGYGFSRSRNGAVNLHAVSCLPAITGAWAVRGGGAVQSLWESVTLDTGLADGLHLPAPTARILDMSRIGPVLNGSAADLGDGPPVTAMIVQNSNPATVAPESALVQRGLARPDLFLAVHEQVMTTTARFADLVLPATTFLEHADLYRSYGHTFLQVARPVIAPLGEARSNHRLMSELSDRLGAKLPASAMSDWELVEAILEASGLPAADQILAQGGLDCAPAFDDAHFLSGFGHEDGRFRFAPDWGDARLPPLPDHMASIDEADGDHPFRLITPPSLHFLNTSFTETESARRLARRPTALIHAADAARLGIADGQMVRLGNSRGSVLVAASLTDGIAPGVVAVEGVWPDDAFAEGMGINCLTSAEAGLPAGGAVFQDTKIWLRPAAGENGA